MKPWNRRQLIGNFGFAGFLVTPLLRASRGWAATNSLKYCQVFKPVGSTAGSFFPTESGGSFSFEGKVTEALERHKNDLIVLKNIELYRPKGNPHALGITRLFSNADSPSPSSGKAIDWAPPKHPSIDHLIANHLSKSNPTSLKTLLFGLQGGTRAIDSISYPAANQLIQAITDPRSQYDLVMKRIHASCQSDGARLPSEEVNPELLAEKSRLDYNINEIKRIKNKLGLSPAEIAKFDIYLEQLRAMELDVARLIAEVKSGAPRTECPNFAFPNELSSQKKLMKLSIDLLVFALQYDLTNVASYMFGSAQASLRMKDLNHDSAWHTLSHSASKVDLERIRSIDRLCYQQVAYLLDVMKSTAMGEGKSLLDLSGVLISGGEISNPLNHLSSDLPLLVAGRAGGSINPGQVIAVEGGSKNNHDNSHANVLLSMCESMGLKGIGSLGVAKWCTSPIAL